jgi:thiol-disulfide isomerase/thioredoxin
MMKKIIKILPALLVLFFVVKPVFAQGKQVNVYFFWGEGCPHCDQEKPFLDQLERKYPTVKVFDFEVWNNAENRRYLIEVGEKLKTDVSGVPFTVVGDEAYIGFSQSLTSEQIEDRLKYCVSNSCSDSVAEIVGITSGENLTQPLQVDTQPEKDEDIDEKKIIPDAIDLPIIGEIQTKDFSLPVFTVVLGVLDGFNPCAMWTLLFLISLLLGMKDKKRRWILGTVFIVTSALVYFLFMAAWLNLILFIGFIVWVRILIGLVALGGGGYNLREFFINKDNACKVTGEKKRQAVFEKLKSITHQRKFLFALGGIILLAFAVNLVELICSAGLPAVFTQVLSLSNLPKWQYYVYMLVYIFFFMVDDLFVFFTAMITLEMTGISTKYSRISHLIGGILMLIIGLLLLFKPELLMFG